MKLTRNIAHKSSHLRGLGTIYLCLTVGLSISHSHDSCGFVAHNTKNSFESRTTSTSDEILHIPVIVHIVYNDENQNITTSRVNSQLQVINEDYNLNNSNLSEIVEEFQSEVSSVNIQFYLSEITRTSTSHGPFFNDDLHRTLSGGKDATDTKKHLNVWVADLAPGVFGYASSPGTEEFKDGVAIHYEYFGRGGSAVAPYDQGRTLTHEIGHWLGLQHLWGAGGCDSDDGLTDTPMQDTAPAGCQLTRESCGSLDMVQNFMNTSEDACLALFTSQQSELMRSTLINDRPEAYDLSGNITGLNSKVNLRELAVYPNPVMNNPEATLRLPQEWIAHEVRLINSSGTAIRKFNILPNVKEVSLDLSGLSNGLYVAIAGEYSTKIHLNIQ